MNYFKKIRSRLRALFGKRKLDGEMDEEMRSHIELRTRANLAAGMRADDARSVAMREFGWTESIKETCRDQRGVSWIETLVQDTRYGLRQLRKNPGFTIIAVLTLALGIGANTAIFSFVNAILLRPLPFKDSDRLVMLFESWPAQSSYKNAVGPILGDWRRMSTAFEGLAAMNHGTFILTGRGQPESLRVPMVSANTFSLLRVKPLLGRDFLPEEETYGKGAVVLLSYEYWSDRFGRDTNIVGQSITLNSVPFQVVGVMPPHTYFPDGAAPFWTPLTFSPGYLQQRHNHQLTVYGRLKPGVSLAQARADMNRVAAQMSAPDAEKDKWGAEVYPWQEIMVGDSRTILLVLLGSVGMVLLIGCVNVANLLLARSASRQREFSIRGALGASRLQIIRQLLTESLLLSVLGGAAGIFLANFGLKALVRLGSSSLPRVWEGIHLDATSLAFTTLATLATALIFGLAPAIQTGRTALSSELNDSSRGSSSGQKRQRVRMTLVVAEVALSLLLLVSAGLLMRSFGNLLSQHLGYTSENLITMGVSLPDKTYPDQAAKTRFIGQFLERVRALPGVQSSAMAFGIPLSNHGADLTVSFPDAPPRAAGEAADAGYEQISPGYFQAMGISFVQGRDFTDQDREKTSSVLIVDEAFVKNFKLGDHVLGQRVNVGDGTDNAEIVGVVKEIRHSGLAEEPRGEMYRPLQQACFGYVTLVVRTQTDPAAMTREIRSTLAEIDKDLPLTEIQTMTQMVSASVGQQKLSMQLLAAFAGVALLLAVIGLYGVLSYNVAQRTQEIGIRMALGAQSGEVIRLVLKQGVGLALAGIAVGLVGALAFTRVMRSMLFGISPSDPLTLIGISCVLGIVALLASWLPARRAAKVDPMVALRHE
ncbi:MAG TPA: ABC transporter permease [Verrucomicrobiae bacterium]|jgi:putative ABC transport system permease protein